MQHAGRVSWQLQLQRYLICRFPCVLPLVFHLWLLGKRKPALRRTSPGSPRCLHSFLLRVWHRLDNNRKSQWLHHPDTGASALYEGNNECVRRADSARLGGSACPPRWPFPQPLPATKWSRVRRSMDSWLDCTFRDGSAWTVRPFYITVLTTKTTFYDHTHLIQSHINKPPPFFTTNGWWGTTFF